MQETVEGGAGHDRIGGENVAPVGKGLVAGEHNRLLFFVALADYLKQKAGLGCLKSKVSNFVNKC